MTKLTVVLALCLMTGLAADGQVFTTIANFNGTNGEAPDTSLVQGIDGHLYGTTIGGGRNNGGTVFKMSRSGKITTLYSFCAQLACIDGEAPLGPVVLSTDGNFYGVTQMGGESEGCPFSSCGTVYKMTPLGDLTTLYKFCAQENCPDGFLPSGGLVRATDGDFYGATSDGGDFPCKGYGCGTVFKITPGGNLTTLHNFNGSEGYAPNAPLIQATDRKLFGVTFSGTIFDMTLGGQFTPVFVFDYFDGSQPEDGIIEDNKGSFYGTTSIGGGYGEGTVFEMNQGGSVTTIYNFCALPKCADGSAPFAGLIQATDGNFYGTTVVGGASQNGTVFRITPSGVLTTLHSFNGSDGQNPDGSLFQATDGKLYGTTPTMENAGCCGTVFSLDMGLGPFVTFVLPYGKMGQTGGILGQGLTGTTSVMVNGIPANFTVISDTFIKATVPVGATTGYVTVTTPTGALTSNVPFHVIR